jgi:oligogalacturonide transport system substrate-binding protein
MSASTFPGRRPLAKLLLALAWVFGAGTAAAQEVPLRLSWWGGNEVHRALLDTVRAFERRHPGIRVRTEYTGWTGHLERLTTQIAGGTAPDVMQINWNWLVLFSGDGTGFYDLHELAEVVDIEAFDAETRAMGTVHGRLNALPTSLAARLFYFNATTFAQAGLTPPRTWDELLAAGPVFRDRLGPDYYPLDLHLQDVIAVTRSHLVQRTGRPLIDEQTRRLTIGPDDIAGMLRFYQALVDAHVIPSARMRASYGHVAPHELRPWVAGRFAGTYQWISAIGKFIDTLAPGQEVVLAPYPMLEGAEDAGLLYRPAMMWAVNARTRHPREAGLLLDFLLNDTEAARIMGLRRGVPVSTRAHAAMAQDGALTGLSVEGMEQVRTLPHAVQESAWFEHARVRDAFIDTFELFAYGRIGADEAGQRLHADINRILARIIR